MLFILIRPELPLLHLHQLTRYLFCRMIRAMRINLSG
jgi:hypothetical protein